MFNAKLFRTVLLQQQGASLMECIDLPIVN